MKEIETKMVRMEVCVDQLEQYSRRIRAYGLVWFRNQNWART